MIAKFISLFIFTISVFPLSLFLSKDIKNLYPWMTFSFKQSVTGFIVAVFLFIILSSWPKEKYPEFLLQNLTRFYQSRYILILAIVIIFITTNFISFLILEHIPHVQDSICQLFQAKIFLSGKLYASP